MQTLLQDVRYGTRMLLKNPGFTAVAVLTLALSIGANTAIFSVMNAVLLRPLPYANAEQLVRVAETNLETGWEEWSVTGHSYVGWKEQNHVFQEIAVYLAFDGIGFNLTGGADPERIRAASVSPTLLPVLGIKPLLGRDFLPEEEQPGRDQVVILSAGLWQRRFGSDPNLLGQPLTLDGRSYTVIGLMPFGFDYPNQAKLWTPLSLVIDRTTPGGHNLGAVARLKPGISLAEAQAEMDTIARRLEQAFPQSNAGWGGDSLPYKTASLVTFVRHCGCCSGLSFLSC